MIRSGMRWYLSICPGLSPVRRKPSQTAALLRLDIDKSLGLTVDAGAGLRSRSEVLAEHEADHLARVQAGQPWLEYLHKPRLS